MTECPFLSSYDSVEECFKECALYNYKGTGGACPFQNLTEYKIIKIDYKEGIESVEKDLRFIKDCYVEMHKEYL